uniref:Uncharacterized protein n=1 Tax=Parascaris univalens TaxID=6257 RepID=A0A915CI37_PARUN
MIMKTRMIKHQTGSSMITEKDEFKTRTGCSMIIERDDKPQTGYVDDSQRENDKLENVASSDDHKDEDDKHSNWIVAG